MRTAIYPGTFDPLTHGHIDVIKKSLKIADRLIVATTDNVNKEYFFTIDERLSIINNSLFKDLKLNKKRIKVVPFNILTINLCKKYNASIIIRGLRAVSDFEYEFLMTGMNRTIDKEIETIFLMSSEKYHFISSRFIKEIHRLGGDISKSVPKPVLDFLKKIWNVHDLLSIRAHSSAGRASDF